MSETLRKLLKWSDKNNELVLPGFFSISASWIIETMQILRPSANLNVDGGNISRQKYQIDWVYCRQVIHGLGLWSRDSAAFITTRRSVRIRHKRDVPSYLYRTYKPFTFICQGSRAWNGFVWTSFIVVIWTRHAWKIRNSWIVTYLTEVFDELRIIFLFTKYIITIQIGRESEKSMNKYITQTKK